VEAHIVIVIGLFFVLVVGALAYSIFRLVRSKEQSRLNPKSRSLARAIGAPKLFDPLLARPMKSREKWGWVIVLLIAVAAIAFTGK